VWVCERGSLDRDGRVVNMPPDSLHCIALRKRIQDLKEECRIRIEEYDDDKLGLPERLGPGEKLSDTRRGHRKNDSEMRIDYQ